MILLGVMGNPIEHSRSPEIHFEFALQHQMEIEYEKLLVPNDGFEESASAFLKRGSRGFNVTLPHKGNAFEFVDELSEDAKISQAVNTVVVGEFEREGSVKIVGHNTDGLGLMRDIQANLGWDIKNKSVLILGAGGAVRGVLARILRAEPKVLHITNRTIEKAIRLEEKFSSTCLKAIPKKDLLENYDFVISGSSAGLSISDISLPSKIITSSTLCYDMIYARTKTPFQIWCNEQGCQKSVDGLGMLVEQAAESFILWTGREVNTGPVIQKLRATI
jgi:shikimate dehydrogenase